MCEPYEDFIYFIIFLNLKLKSVIFYAFIPRNKMFWFSSVIIWESILYIFKSNNGSYLKTKYKPLLLIFFIIIAIAFRLDTG